VVVVSVGMPPVQYLGPSTGTPPTPTPDPGQQALGSRGERRARGETVTSGARADDQHHEFGERRTMSSASGVVMRRRVLMRRRFTRSREAGPVEVHVRRRRSLVPVGSGARALNRQANPFWSCGRCRSPLAPRHRRRSRLPCNPAVCPRETRGCCFRLRLSRKSGVVRRV
jgi:hypothetical protein